MQPQKISLDEWDREVASKLNGLERDLVMISMYLGRFVSRLPSLQRRPPWPTNVEAKIEELLELIEQAKADLKQGLEDYRNKPTVE